MRLALAYTALALSALSTSACNNQGVEDQAPAQAAAVGSAAASNAAAAPSASAAQPDAEGVQLASLGSCSPACDSLQRCEAKGAEARCVSQCPAGTVYIPATGPDGFQMGSGAPGSDDQKHQVVLTKPFCMDATEVTVAAYRACVTAGKCTVPQLRDINANYRDQYHRPNHPVNMVNYKQSQAYCEAQGMSLPTEAQWEYAASRGDGRKYPWGDEPEPTCENGYADFTPGGSQHEDPAGDVGCHGGGTSEVKAHPLGKVSWPDGDLYDMGGNLWEWTLDCFVPYPRGRVIDPKPSSHPNLKGGCYVYSLRGGGWNRSTYSMRTFSRAASKLTYRVPALGFRCVKNAE